MNTSLGPLLGRNWWVFVLYGLIAVVFGVIAILQPLATAIALAWTFGVMALAEAVITVVALFHREVDVSRGWLVFYGLVSLAFGLLGIFHPVAVAGALLVLLAAWLIVAGIYRIAFAIRVRRVIRGEWLMILSGALGILLGAMFLLRPLSGLVVATLWIGMAALFYGVLQVAAGFRLRRVHRSP
jgi:uncharacterized membrane protein HdeD (DUF308 family)